MTTSTADTINLSDTRHHITLAAAQAAVAAAVAAAEEQGLRINVAVVDGSGTLVAFARMGGAFLHSIDIAIDKAYTAASFGFPTAQWGALLAGDESLRLGLAGRPRLVIFGGGLPVHEAGELIGGIGVSGGSAGQDEACARAGLHAIGLQ
ncbi:hypothetical protein LMG23992_01418 [Cupriavidus laharis]|uniref:Heme-binding protein n=1 Tax=Cupriavidus laharis TaxID=151654 RepID=A0ABM8WP52_9BURK|nr:heme-binding protein [Cupriavidus laharis]CAG9169198.1 hypothetical protein LMG23992_01418 [Cupriavidus laharis]